MKSRSINWTIPHCAQYIIMCKTFSTFTWCIDMFQISLLHLFPYLVRLAPTCRIHLCKRSVLLVMDRVFKSRISGFGSLQKFCHFEYFFSKWSVLPKALLNFEKISKIWQKSKKPISRMIDYWWEKPYFRDPGPSLVSL